MLTFTPAATLAMSAVHTLPKCGHPKATTILAWSIAAAVLASALATWTAAAAVLGLALVAWCMDRDAELAMRTAYLAEQRTISKAHHFHCLLSCMLPLQIVQQYFELCLAASKGGRASIGAISFGEMRPRCGVLFTAICDFDDFVADRPAHFVVRFLNKLFSAFDAACVEAGAGITKVETVGEVHVSACGVFRGDLAQRGFEDQFAALAELALEMHTIAGGLHVRIRSGLHVGRVVAGIVGTTLPRFRLFGGTVNVAARLEQNCPPGSVLLSPEAKELLPVGVHSIREYRELPMKGLGQMATWELPPVDELPEPEESLTPTSSSGSPEATPGSRERSNSFPLAYGLQGRALLLSVLGQEGRHERSTSYTSSCTSTPKEAPVDFLRSRSLSQPLMPSLTEVADSRPTSPQTPAKGVPGGAPPPCRFCIADPDSCSTPAASTASTSTPAARQRPPPLRKSCTDTSAGPQSSDEEGEMEALPTVVRFRTRSPTAWLSADAQLGRRAARRPTVRAPRPVPEGLEGRRDVRRVSLGQQEEEEEPGQQPSKAAADAVLDESKEDFDFADPVRQDISRRIGDALSQDHAHNILWGFACQDREHRFRATYGSRGIGDRRRRAAATAWCALAVVPAALGLRSAPPARCLALAALAGLGVLPHALPKQRPRLAGWLLASLASPLICLAAMYGGGGAQGQTRLLASALAWVWPVLGQVLRLPCSSSAPALLVALGLALLTADAQHLAGPVICFWLQWADERVERRDHRIEQLQLDTQERLQGVAENLMPPFVVHQLRRMRFGRNGPKPSLIWHQYDQVTVLQADLAGFTAFARDKKPEEVVCVVNGLFSVFDDSVAHRGVYKMETIGDAYVCVSGLPGRKGQTHSAAAMLLLALDFVGAVNRYKRLCNMPEDSLGVRAGVHSGACVAGIIGTAMLRYHLFGRTMHIVEVLESTTPTYTVHFSERTKDLLDLERDAMWQEYTATVADLPPLTERCPEAGLLTSKGEALPPEAVDGLRTFVLSTTGGSRSPQARGRGEATPLQGAARWEESRGSKGAKPSPAIVQLDLAVRWHSAVLRTTAEEPRSFFLRAGSRPFAEDAPDGSEVPPTGQARRRNFRNTVG